MGEYEVVIGLEVHSELNTKTKCFCACKNEFGSDANTNVCPVCTGMPGSLPVLNQEAVKKAILMGLAVGCKINNYSVFERKNYYYPDLSKSYQISQLEFPLCVGGGLEIEIDGKKKFIRLDRIHLEEDAAKLIHNPSGTLVDYNRGGVPLIEIVSMPDMNSAEEVVLYLEKLRSTLLYVGVSDCKMQEGSIKFDCNISVHKQNEPLGTRTELKNLNSFSAVARAIKYESKRQIEELEAGNKIVQETRRWDDEKGKTFAMRSKEDSQDYRYFPDPDIIPINVSNEYIDKIRSQLPKLADERRLNYEKMGLSTQDAMLLTSQRSYSDFFDEVISVFNQPKFVCNWITAEVFKKLNNFEEDERVIKVNPKDLAELMELYYNEKINQSAARKVFDMLWDGKTEPKKIIEEEGLAQVSDVNELQGVIKNIMDSNPKAVAELKEGNQKTMAFFVGQAMRATQGKANPKVVAEIVNELIKKSED